LAGERGFCGLDSSVRVFRELLHPAEEAPLNPSHQIYFAGCNLRCEFCSVLEWVDAPDAAEPMSLAGLLACVETRRQQGAVTLNLLGGEPAVNIHGVLRLLSAVPPSTAVVWNSNMYYRACVGRWLDGLVDYTLADLKCAADICAETLLGAGDYVQVARRNIQQAADFSEVIIRCLVLPGHLDCCVKPTLEWVAAHLPQAQVSLRGDYIPPRHPRHAPAEYGRPGDAAQARALSERLGLQVVT
jgi:putative pyruvate formate lyase activating enzyme